MVKILAKFPIKSALLCNCILHTELSSSCRYDCEQPLTRLQLLWLLVQDTFLMLARPRSSLKLSCEFQLCQGLHPRNPTHCISFITQNNFNFFLVSKWFNPPRFSFELLQHYNWILKGLSIYALCDSLSRVKMQSGIGWLLERPETDYVAVRWFWKVWFRWQTGWRRKKRKDEKASPHLADLSPH